MAVIAPVLRPPEDDDPLEPPPVAMGVPAVEVDVLTRDDTDVLTPLLLLTGSVEVTVTVLGPAVTVGDVVGEVVTAVLVGDVEVVVAAVVVVVTCEEVVSVVVLVKDVEDEGVDDVMVLVMVLVGVTVVCEVMAAELVAELADVLVDMAAVGAGKAVNQRLWLLAVAVRMQSVVL